MTTEISHSYRLSFSARGELLTWHAALQSETAQGLAKADKAVLRRAHDLQTVMESAAYQRVYQRMAKVNQGAAWRPHQQERVATLVALLAHLKNISDTPLPVVMGRAKRGEKSAVSELRFRRILEAPDMDALFSGLRRALPLIDAEANASRLIDDIFGWGDFVKRQWAYAYYGASGQ
jgi:CRISPR system Cascade subunit CasB